MLLKNLVKYRAVIFYGTSLAAVLFLLKWLEYRFVIIDHSFEIYITCIAIIFTALGIWLALKLAKPKIETHIETIVVEKEVFVKPDTNHTFVFNEAERERLGLSNRELEVLQLMSEGLSNQEIASRLFVSLNTIKTHSSKLFEKMDVKRRTQAIEKAKRLNIIQ
jgi:two-component system, NarL family, response regulator LiaR